MRYEHKPYSILRRTNMKNEILKEILSLISTSNYVLQPQEQNVVNVCQVVADSGADLPADEALQLENLFEKIKRGGYLTNG